MKKTLLFTLIVYICAGCVNKSAQDVVIARMDQDSLATKVETKAMDLFTTDLRAGDGYGEVWIRDYNSFIELAMKRMPDPVISQALTTFFYFQGEDGNIVDGYIERSNANMDDPEGYRYRVSELCPEYVAHKNTVETDHEASLIQAVYKYVKNSGNKAYLSEVVNGKSVLERLEFALDFLRNHKTDSTYGLLIGATTADWGDVQPEHAWGVMIDDDTHYSIDIYDNAMYVIAINNYLELTDDNAATQKWTAVRDSIKANVRKHLWDEQNQKFIPHIYLDGSPFPEDFDENQIYYHGGTAVAALAGMLTKDEVKSAYERMLSNQQKAQAQTIGLTLYPVYPEGYFKNEGMYPYGYQNGGDWTWFGARMVVALAQNGLYEEAYDALKPMLERIIANDGFYEWYTPAGKPMGSGVFRGEAGVLHTAIQSIYN